jgi:hypothetical protein
MNELPWPMVVEGGVAVLLAVTIGYCIVLNTKLTRLRGDREAMRLMIGELMAATDKAHEAIRGLRETAEECDLNLSAHLNEAERFSVELAHHINAGNAVLTRISRITQAARPREASEPAAPSPPAPSLQPISSLRAALSRLEDRARIAEEAA